MIVNINDVPVTSLDALRRVVFNADPEEELTVNVQRAVKDAKQTAALKIKSVSLASELPESIPSSLQFVEGEAWQIDEVKLPDISNQIVFVGPKRRILTSRLHSHLGC